MSTDDDGIADPTARLRGLLTTEQRRILDTIERLKARYVESDRDDEIASQIERLIENACTRKDPSRPHSGANRVEGLGCLLIAAPGAGKTRTLQHAFKEHPAFPGYGNPKSGCQLITIKTPNPFNMKQLGIEILKAMDCAPERDLHENVVWWRVRFHIPTKQILILHIDDGHDVLRLESEKDIKLIRNTLRGMLNSIEWPLQLFLSGTKELVPFLQADEQFKRRFGDIVQFEPVSPEADGDFIEKVIRDYAKAAGLKLDVRPEDQLVGRLCRAVSFARGMVFAVLISAIRVALKNGSKTLTMEDFADVYGERTLQPADQNPFLAHAWDVIDTSLLRPKDEDLTVDDVAEQAAPDLPPRARRRKGRTS